MSLKKYQSKRHFQTTPEPLPQVKKGKGKELTFVIQEHAARRLHYDLRLEVDGVLKSWAVPKGPSLDPKDKRLAIMVEDHPYDYQFFEGIIPEGYGAGKVVIWDKGTYHVGGASADESERKMREGLKNGELHFSLEGEKLHGEFILTKLKNSPKENEWLLIKKKDDFATKQETESLIEDPKDLIKKAPKKTKTASLIKPMLTTLVDKPFDDSAWIYEIKWDGYRAIAELNDTKVKFYSRNGLSFNDKFPSIVEHLKHLKLKGIFDGEVVYLDEKGRPNFQSLQNILQEKATSSNLYYYLFDILYLGDKDLRGLPLVERKQILASLLKSSSKTPIRYCEHIENKGIEFFQSCVKLGLEGIIAKKKESLYLEGKRTYEWLKIKAHLRQEAIICGYTVPKGSRKNFGALLLGVYEGKNLRFIGHVGGGFTDKRLVEVKKLLDPLVQKECPFKEKPKTNMPVTWVKPHYLCEVSFSEWTQEGIMRQPIFVGLREDKEPKEVVLEKEEETKKVVSKKGMTKKKVELTNLDKLYWPKEKITKGDLIDYYTTIAPYILPYLKDRPQSLKRFPNGIEGVSFFQKNLDVHPDWVQTTIIEHKHTTNEYLLIQDLDTLLYAVNLGCIELHPFFSKYQTLDYPDFLTFDLDPESTSFDNVILVAQELHAFLDELSLPHICKTSGATGMHISMPLKAKYTYEEAKNFAKIIASIIHRRLPKISSLERSPKNRQKKVYIDCLQNNLGQTLASVYSVRAKPKAPVSTPLLWSEVHKGMRPEDFTLFNMPERLKKLGDICKPLLSKGINMKKTLQKLESFLE